MIHLAAAYKNYTRFIQNAYEVTPPENTPYHSVASALLNASRDSNSNLVEKNPTQKALKVMFVQRSKNRVILNMDQLTSLADSLGFEWYETILQYVRIL